MAARKKREIEHPTRRFHADPFYESMLGLAAGSPEEYDRVTASRGAAEVRMSDELPAKDTADPEVQAALLSLGFKLGGVQSGNPMFREAEMPKGWTRKSTDHYMYTNVLDAKGRVRAQIGFKAQAYDPWTSFVLYRRFSLRQIYPKDQERERGTVKFSVRDRLAKPEKDGSEGIIFTTVGVHVLRKNYTRNDELEKEHVAACAAWLDRNYPKWQEHTGHWDDEKDAKPREINNTWTSEIEGDKP